MNQLEQIVEEILIENDIDFDHPVVPFLFEDVEDALNELSDNTLKSYLHKTRNTMRDGFRKYYKVAKSKQTPELWRAAFKRSDGQDRANERINHRNEPRRNNQHTVGRSRKLTKMGY